MIKPSYPDGGDLLWLTELVESRTLRAQMEAITAQEPLVVVSAGAGTGKTWTLAWRFLWAVATGRARSGEILTLTFTDKAATEMADRIRSLMSTVLEMAPEGGPVRANLSAGLEELDDGYISTIHSFASRVIKESGLSLNLDPSSRVVSAPEEDLFWRQMVDVLDRVDLRWIGTNLSGDVRRKAISILMDPVVQGILGDHGPDNVISFVRGLMDISSSRGDRPDTLWGWSEDLPDRHDQVAMDALRIAHAMWEGIYRIWFGPLGICRGLTLDSTALAGRIKGLMDRWGDYREDLDLPAFLADLADAIKGARGKLSDSIALMLPEGSVKLHREAILAQSFLWDLSRDGWSDREIEITSGLLKLAGLCWHCWEGRKSGRGLIAFDDMILHAGKVLEGDLAYSCRFKEIMVDEFQDTNGLQDRLIRSMSDGKRLFLVGDLKQSIYRFRHADLSIFGKYITEAQTGGGKYVSLDVSFRTRDTLLQSVNGLFSGVWRDGLGQDLPHRYEELRPPVNEVWHRRRQEVSVPTMELLLVPHEEKVKAEERRLRSMELLAGRLSSLVGEACFWDKGKEDLVRLRWRDVAILVPSRSIFPAIQRILGDRWGIPLHFEKNTSYYARTEVQDSVALLNFLSDPSDDLALAGFLCSPLSGLTLSDAQAFIFLEGAPSERLAEAFPDLAARLSMWREIGLVRGASSVVQELAADGAILDRFAEWKRSGVAANLRRTVDLLREYESTVGSGLSGAASWLSYAMRRSAKEEEAVSVGADEDVVKVMTVHASKGLEFPLVVLAGCDSSSRGFPQALPPSSFLGVGLSDEGFLSRKVHRFLDDQAEEEERERLLYVACTRARDGLILVGDEEPQEGSWLRMVLSGGGAASVVKEVQDASPREDETVRGKRGPTVPSPSRSGGLERISPTSWAMFRHCPYGWRLKFRQGLDLSWEGGEGSEPGGADIGTLAHWILARWDFSLEGIDKVLSVKRSALPPDIRHLWGQVEVTEMVRGWLSDMAEGEHGKKLRYLRDARRLRREVPFRVPIEGGPLLVGAVDLMWEEDGVVHIWDYKTTSHEEYGDGLYGDQLRMYGLAVALSLEPKPRSVEMELCLLRDGCSLRKVRLSPFKDWSELEATIRADALTAALGPWGRSTDICDGCPFKRTCRGGVL